MASPVASEKRLSAEFIGSVARITFHHPPLNVIDFQMMDELFEVIQTLEQHSEISAVIFSGGERGFSAGVDVAVHTPDKIQAMFQKFHGVIGALAKCRKQFKHNAHRRARCEHQARKKYGSKKARAHKRHASV